MKASKIILTTLFAVLLLIGCKTTKLTTELNSDVQTTENRDVVEKSDGIKVVDVADLVESETETETTTEKKTEGKTSDEMVITKTTTLLSEPDSTGKQYPTSITIEETKRIKQSEQVTNDKQVVNDKQVTNHARDSTAAEQLATERNDKSDLKSNSSVQLNEQTKTKVKTPGLFNYVAILLAVGALVFFYFILRRYKIL